MKREEIILVSLKQDRRQRRVVPYTNWFRKTRTFIGNSLLHYLPLNERQFQIGKSGYSEMDKGHLVKLYLPPWPGAPSLHYPHNSVGRLAW